MSDDAPTFWDVRANLTAPRRPSAPKAKPAGSDDEPWSVSQFADEADHVLKAGFADDLRLRGEVGEWTVSTAGHGYMTLKDAKARVQTVIYQSKLSRNRFRPEVGDEVIVRGRVNFYGRGGQLSIICDRIDPAGEGAIEAAIRRLREKLANEGLFDASRKLAVPRFPSRVVLVTSPQADALQDALKVLRPFPSVRLALYPVTVQGDAAASSVADAIAHLDATRGGTGRIDAILLIRGGGSREDLRAFDDEAVVRAIAACRIPVVTGIGHDTDVSLSDGVADVHAHTPTQAARTIIEHWSRAADDVDRLAIVLRRDLRRTMEAARTSLIQVRRHEAFRRPEELVERRRRDLDFATSAFSNAHERHRRRQGDRLARVRDQLRQLEPAAQLRRQRTTLDTLSRRLDGVRQKLVASVRHRLTREQARLAANAPSRQIAARRSQLQAAQRTLETLSPLAVLARGYSITTTVDGRVVQRQADAPPGTTIETRLADGTLKSRVEAEG